jgi:hypothetical protein
VFDVSGERLGKGNSENAVRKMRKRSKIRALKIEFCLTIPNLSTEILFCRYFACRPMIIFFVDNDENFSPVERIRN